MVILPAIDLRGGKVVRLSQGDYSRETVYADSPGGVARGFAAAGCTWVHVVDLDAARQGEPVNLSALADVAVVAGLHVEAGGGARDDVSLARMLEAGAARVVIGSAAMENWAWFESLVRREELRGRIALGLDARGGKLALRGWVRQTEATAVEVARRVKGWPLAAIIYTDIARDGMLTGPNVEATAEVLAATDVPVIASGGVSRVADLAALRGIGCAGAIIGRAYYEGKVDLAEALRVAQGGP